LNPARKARKLDVLLTHAPPVGWGPSDDLAHRGFNAFTKLVNDLNPRLMVHGHVHPYGRAPQERRLGATQVINAVPLRLIEL
jgi:Icc-related predicted phosphoesterase